MFFHFCFSQVIDNYQEHNHANSSTITATELSNKKNNNIAKKTNLSKSSNIINNKTSDVVSNQSINNNNNLSFGDEPVKSTVVNRSDANHLNNNIPIIDDNRMNSVGGDGGDTNKSSTVIDRTMINLDDFQKSQKTFQNASRPAEILSWREPNNKFISKSSNNHMATTSNTTTNYQQQPSATGHTNHDNVNSKNVDNINQLNTNNRDNSYGSKAMPLSNRESNKYAPKSTTATIDNDTESASASVVGKIAPQYVDNRLPIVVHHNHEDIVHFVGEGECRSSIQFLSLKFLRFFIL